MAVLVIGLLAFIGIHSVRIVAPSWRDAQIGRFGKGAWHAVFGSISLTGLIVIVYGYGIARRAPVLAWSPPMWMPHLAAALTALAFVVLASALLPASSLKQRLVAPLPAAIALWAFAHLLANGTFNAIVLFGSLFVWSFVLFAVTRARHVGTTPVRASLRDNFIAVALGLAAWAIFVFELHGPLIGVRPLG